MWLMEMAGSPSCDSSGPTGNAGGAGIRSAQPGAGGNRPTARRARHSSSLTKLWPALLAGWLLGSGAAATATAQSLVGFRDFSFGNTCNSTPTGEKPESKLWINDGLWWGSLCNPTAKEYRIYRLDLATQQWVDTGTALDNRTGSKADTLWDAASQKLYVVSHVFTTTGQPVSSSGQWGRLYRYSYNASTKRYSLDSGFPVTVTRGKSETLVLARDSTGRLWVTYVESNKVMVNHSVGSDTVWRDPYILPVDQTAITSSSDDISSVLAFQGDKIGLMWSNQQQKKFYFAVHLDGAADTAWQMDTVGIPGPPCSGDCGDDHINLKSIQVDSTGRVFAAIKTSLTASNAPLVMLTVRSNSGNWSSYVFGRKTDGHTRPVVLLDEENGRIYMFATSPESSGKIYYKSTDINNISFPVGLGNVFIGSPTDVRINNATSTKQNLNSSTGLVVLASDQDSNFYLHNYLALNPSGTPTADFSGSPVTGPAPLTVNFTDLSTGSPTSWSWTFGDGGTSTQQNPSHIYSAAGQYTVSLTATNGAGPNTKTKTNYISVSAGAPVADFSGSPTSGQAPLTVNFTDLSTGSPTSWSWTFGDGGTSTQQNPSHIYSAAGQYTVSLTATNGDGPNTATKTNYITVSAGPQPPSADFSGSPTSGQAPLTVNFTDLSTGSPTSWSWAFGDGGTSTLQNPSHIYSAAGQYTVSLTAANAAGPNTATKTNYITVSTGPQPPSADFSGSPTSGQAPLTVNFTDLSTGSPTSWSWAFGDGGTSTLQNPSHIYSAAGQYTVSLTAANAAGPNTATKTNYITVSSSTGSISHSETRTGGSSGSNLVSTSTSLTGVAGDLYLAAVSTKPRVAVTGVSGMGLIWTPVRAQCAGRNQTGIEVWMAQGTPSGNGGVTATLGSAPLNAVIAVSRYSGVNSSTPIGNIASGNTNGAGGLCSGGVDSNGYSFDLPAPTTGAVVYGAAAMRNRTHTPGAGYTERAEIAQGASGDIASVAAQDKAGSLTAVLNGSFSGVVDWAVIGIEIKP